MYLAKETKRTVLFSFPALYIYHIGECADRIKRSMGEEKKKILSKRFYPG